MRQVIADALGIKAIAIGDDGAKRSCGIARRLDKAQLTEKLMNSLPPCRSASLLIAVTVLAGTSASQAQAEPVEPRAPVQLAQAAASDPKGSQGVPEQELYRAETMARGLAAARRDLESVLTLLSKARDESARIRGASENEDAQQREAPQQERERAGRLEQELAAARRDVAAQAARADKAAAEADQLKQAAKDEPVELRKSLQQERERAGRLEQALAVAQRDVETQTALAAKAAEETARNKQAAESASAELQKSLQQERERADRLEQALAAAQHDVETQTALAAKAREEAARDKQVAESSSAELEKSLQQARETGARLERELALARSTKEVSAAPEGLTGQLTPPRQREADAAGPVATVAEARGAAQGNPPDTAEVARLMARASMLLGQGDIGSARIVLERAAETGSAQASFALAETYDPLVLPKWGAYGTRGDASKAQALYAKAEAGGIKEAKARSDALRR